MSKVDWSLAPNWATHALVKLHNPGICGVHWSYFIDGEHRISPDGLRFHPDGYRVAEERPRNFKHKPWSGPEDGLPPVNSVCEINHSRLGWVVCEIVAHKHMDCGGKPHAIAWIDGNNLDQSQGNRFRPIKTPEQLASEKRETAIREFMDVVGIDCRVTASKAVDAGFKREVV